MESLGAKLCKWGGWALMLSALTACAYPSLPDEGNAPLATVSAAKIGVELAGTGFFVDKLGHVMTADHAVSNCLRRYVSFGGETFRAALVGRSPADDIALVKIEKTVDIAAVFPRTPRGAEQGAVFAAGYRVLQDLLGRGGTLSNAVVIRADVEGPSRNVTLYSQASFGSSGAPVLSSGGLVIGVITHRLVPDRVVATNADRVKDLLAAQGVAFVEDDRPQLGPLTDRAQFAQNISAQVICMR